MKNSSKKQDILRPLANFQQYCAVHPLSSKQDLQLPTPAVGQLHHFKASNEMPESFVLVIEATQKYCKVIPGSFDALRGGPNDIVLPRSVMGDFVILSLDLAGRVSPEELDIGFAKLDAEVVQKILNSLHFYQGMKEKGDRYHFALPYIGKSDERINYHSQLANVLARAQLKTPVPMPGFTLWQAASQNKNIRAAAKGVGKEMRFELSLPTYPNIALQLVFAPADNTFNLNVFGADDNYSTALDGFQLRTANEVIVGLIQDGHLRWSVSDSCDCCTLILTDHSGAEVPVEWSRKP